MRQWFRTLALGAVVTMVVAAPAAAQDGDCDDAPLGSTERVAEKVTDQAQYRLGSSDAVTPSSFGDAAGDQARVRDRDCLRDGTGDGCVADCDGDRATDQARVRDRDRLRDGTGDGCVADCDGDRAMEMERLRQRIRDARDGCEAGWMFAHCHAWAHQVAL